MGKHPLILPYMGALKMRDRKMQDQKCRGGKCGTENAALGNAGPGIQIMSSTSTQA